MKPSKGRFLDLLCLFFCLSATHFCTSAWAQTVEIKWSADSLQAEVPAGAKCANLSGAAFDTNDKTEGTASMRFTSPTGDVQGEYGCRDFPQTTLNMNWNGGKWLCQYFDMKVASDFNWDRNQNKIKMQRMVNNGRWTMYLNSGGIDISECPTCNTCTGGDRCSVVSYSMRPGGSNPVESWQSYTIGIKMETGSGANNGQMKFWVNGALVDSLTNQTYCASCNGAMTDAWGVFGMKPFPQSPDGMLWFDDFLMTSSVNECAPRGASGGGSKSKRPASPTNLQEISP